MNDFYHFTLEEERSKIHKMCLSPDNNLLVHVLKGLDNLFYIYLSRIEDMISWIKESNKADGPSYTLKLWNSKSTSEVSRSLSRGSTQPVEPFILPWKHIHLKPRNNCRVENIQALQFSANSDLFTLYSEPLNANKCIFYAWTTEKGEFVNSISLTRAVC